MVGGLESRSHSPGSQLASPCSAHPRHSNGNSHMALGDRRSELTTAGSALGCARGRHPRLGLAVRCGDLAKKVPLKKHTFLCVFYVQPCVQPKHRNGAIFVITEGFRPCLSNPSYGAPQWALMVRLMQKERLKSHRKSLFYVTGLAKGTTAWAGFYCAALLLFLPLFISFLFLFFRFFVARTPTGTEKRILPGGACPSVGWLVAGPTGTTPHSDKRKICGRS